MFKQDGAVVARTDRDTKQIALDLRQSSAPGAAVPAEERVSRHSDRNGPITLTLFCRSLFSRALSPERKSV
jgi:hypothetical protein